MFLLHHDVYSYIIHNLWQYHNDHKADGMDTGFLEIIHSTSSDIGE
jgi:hypothetical protein